MSYESMNDCISPASPRGTPLLPDDSFQRSLDSCCSITDLSQQFDRHTLEPPSRVSITQPPPPQNHDQHTTMGRERSSTNNHHTLRRQRDFMMRRQCSAANMSRLSSLVQDILRDQDLSEKTNHLKSEHDDPIPSLNCSDQLPVQSPTASLASPSSSSEDSELDSPRSSWNTSKYRIGKDLKHSESREGVRQYKEIRIRKTVKRRTSTLSSG